MWLAWVGLPGVIKKGEKPALPKAQLVVMGVLATLALAIWFAFGLTDKLAFDRPGLLLLALIALPIFALGAWSLQQLGPARRWASVGLRVFVLLLITAMLAGFRTVQTHDELTVVSLIDTSESVRKFYTPPPGPDGQPQDYEQWLASYFAQAGNDKRGEDYWSVQTFDGRPTIRLSPSLGEVTIPVGSVDQPYEGSNVQRAIESAMAAKQRGDSALRIVLVSDGNLDGEVMAAVQAAAAAGVQIDVVPLQYKVKGEVMVEAVRANPEARKGQTVKVSVELREHKDAARRELLQHAVLDEERVLLVVLPRLQKVLLVLLVGRVEGQLGSEALEARSCLVQRAVARCSDAPDLFLDLRFPLVFHFEFKLKKLEFALILFPGISKEAEKGFWGFGAQSPRSNTLKRCG